MSAASLASFVIGKLTSPEARTGEAGDMTGRGQASTPRLTTVWRPKSIPYDIPDTNHTFRSEGSLLRLLRSRSMPLLGRDGTMSPGRQAAPLGRHSPARSESLSPVRHAAGHSATTQGSGHVSDASESTVASLATPPPTPRSPSPTGQRRSRSQSDGHLWQRRKRQMRKSTEPSTVALPSVRNLRGKFENMSPSPQDEERTAEPGQFDEQGPEADMGPNRRLVRRHNSLLRPEPKSPERLQPPKPAVTAASVRKRLQEVKDSPKDADEAGEVFVVTDEKDLHDKSHSKDNLKSTTTETSSGQEPRRRLSTPARMRPKNHRRSKSEPDPASVLRFHAQSSPPSVRKLKMLFERDTVADSSREPPPLSPRKTLREPTPDPPQPQRVSPKPPQEVTVEDTDGAEVLHLGLMAPSVPAKTPPMEQVDPVLAAGTPSVRSLRSRFEAGASGQSFKATERETTSRSSRAVVHTLKTPFEGPQPRQARSVSPEKDTRGSLTRFSSASVKNLLRQFEAMSPEEALRGAPGYQTIDERSRGSPVKDTPRNLHPPQDAKDEVKVDPKTEKDFKQRLQRQQRISVSSSSSSSSSDEEERENDKRRERELERRKEEDAKEKQRIEQEQREKTKRMEEEKAEKERMAREKERIAKEEMERKEKERAENERQANAEAEQKKVAIKILEEAREKERKLEEEKRKQEREDQERRAKEEIEKKKAMELLEKQRKEKEEKEKLERDMKERKAREEKERKEREEKERKEREEKERKEREEKERKEREEKERKEREEKERKEREEKERKVRDEKERKEREEKERREREEKARKEREEKERKEREEKEKERKVREEKERREREEKARKEREEKERKEREEKERKEREKNEREERERKEREENARKERERAEEKRKYEKEELERKRREEAARKEAQEEEERRKQREREETERLQKEKREAEKRRQEEKRREEEKRKEEEKRREEEKKRKEELIRRQSSEEMSKEVKIMETRKKGKSESHSSDSDSDDGKDGKCKSIEHKVHAMIGHFTQEGRREASPPRDAAGQPGKEHGVDRLIDQFTNLKDADLESEEWRGKVSLDVAVDGNEEEEGENRRSSDVATLVQKFRKMNARRRSSSSSSDSDDGKAIPEKPKKEAAPIPTIPTRTNVPGKVRTLRADELRFFETSSGDGATEPFMRTQSLRGKKSEPPPFTIPRFGSLRGNKSRVAVLSTSSATNAALPRNCRHLNTDELRFFTGEVTNIYRSRAAKGRGGKTTRGESRLHAGPQDNTLPDSEKFFRLAGRGGPAPEANGRPAPSDEDSDFEPSVLRGGDEPTDSEGELYEMDITLRSENDTDYSSDTEQHDLDHPMSLLVHSIQGKLLHPVDGAGAAEEDTRCYVVFSPGGYLTSSDDEDDQLTPKFPLASPTITENAKTPTKENRGEPVVMLDEEPRPAPPGQTVLLHASTRASEAGRNTLTYTKTEGSTAQLLVATSVRAEHLVKASTQAADSTHTENGDIIDYGQTEATARPLIALDNLLQPMTDTPTVDKGKSRPLLTRGKCLEETDSSEDEDKRNKENERGINSLVFDKNDIEVAVNKTEIKQIMEVKRAKEVISKKEIKVGGDILGKEAVIVKEETKKEQNAERIVLVNEINIFKMEKEKLDDRKEYKTEEIKYKKHEKEDKKWTKKEVTDRKREEQEENRDKIKEKIADNKHERMEAEKEMREPVKEEAMVAKKEVNILETKQPRSRIDPDEKVDQEALATFLDELDKLNSRPRIIKPPPRRENPKTHMNAEDSSSEDSSSDDEGLNNERLISLEEQIIPLASFQGLSVSPGSPSGAFKDLKDSNTLPGVTEDLVTVGPPSATQTSETKEWKEGNHTSTPLLSHSMRQEEEEKTAKKGIQRTCTSPPPPLERKEMEKETGRGSIAQRGETGSPSPQEENNIKYIKHEKEDKKWAKKEVTDRKQEEQEAKKNKINEKIADKKQERMEAGKEMHEPVKEEAVVAEKEVNILEAKQPRSRIDPDEKVDQEALATFLDELDKLNSLPRIIKPPPRRENPKTHMNAVDSSSEDSSSDDEGLNNERLICLEEQIIPLASFQGLSASPGSPSGAFKDLKDSNTLPGVTEDLVTVGPPSGTQTSEKKTAKKGIQRTCTSPPPPLERKEMEKETGRGSTAHRGETGSPSPQEENKDIMTGREFIKFCIFSIWFSLLMYFVKDFLS